MKSSPNPQKSSDSKAWDFSEALRVIGMTVKESLFSNEKKQRPMIAANNNWQLQKYDTIHTIESGYGDHKWLFLHGTPAHARKWEWYLSNIPDDHHFIAVDRPGFGLNRHTKNFSNIEAQSQLMAPLFKNDSDYIVIGHSFGGALAAQLAVDYPKSVKAIILLGASLDPALEPLHPLQKLGALFPFSLLLPKIIENSNYELLSLHHSLPVLQKKLKDVQKSILVVHAKDDPLCSFDNIEFYRKNFTNAKIKEILLDEGGHYIPWEQPEWLLETILEFEKNIG